MKSRQADIILGMVVIAFVTLFVGTYLFIYPQLGGTMRPLEVRFKHDAGMAPLTSGSAVMLSGALQVGQVKRVSRRVITDKEGERQLMIVVDADVEADLQLFDDCRITTQQPPVGGGGVLVILNVGSQDAPELAGAPVAGLPPQSFAAAISGLSVAMLGPGGIVEKIDHMLDADAAGSLAASLRSSLDDVSAMTRQLRTQLDPNQQRTLMSKIQSIMINLNETTAALREQSDGNDASSLLAKIHTALDRLDSGLVEVQGILHENRPALRSTLADAQAMSGTLRQKVITPLAGEMDAENPEALLGELHAGMDDLRTSLSDIAAATDTARKLVVLNRPALQQTIDNIKQVSDQMRSGMQELLLTPWRLFQPPGSELKRLDVFEAARHFAQAANDLDDATRRLEAVAAAKGRNGQLLRSPEEIAAIQAALQSAFERFEKAENYFWDKLK